MTTRRTAVRDLAPRTETTPPSPAPAAAGPVRRRFPMIAARAPLPVALGLWLLSLRHVQYTRMRDLGLLQVLPALFWVALVLVTVGFVAVLRERRTSHRWLVAYTLGLIAIIHATPSVLYPGLRYAWAWKHVDVIDAMMRHNGSVANPGWLDIYNQWPGFFSANGLLIRIGGLHSAMGYAQWATPVVNALMLAPLILIYRTVTRDWRLIWGGVWIFYSCSWIGQDYFAPQTFGFLLYLTLIALVLRQLPGTTPPGPEAAGEEPDSDSEPDADPADGPAGASDISAPARPVRGFPGGWRLPRYIMVLLIELVIITSHQLTPLIMIAALTALSLPRRNRRTVLPVLLPAAVFQLVWFGTVARPFMAANMRGFIKAVTDPGSNAPAWLAGLGVPAPGQLNLAWVDRGLTAVVVLLALVGFIRRRWTRRTALPLLALAPMPMPALNSYGGEMIFRAYLFALPACALLIAALILRPGALPRVRTLGVFVLLLSFLAGLVFGYYGKEDIEYFTAGEAAASRYLTADAPPGSLIVSVTNNIPDIDRNYDGRNRVVLAWNHIENRRLLVSDPLAGLNQAVAQVAPQGPVYLILSRGQTAENYLTGLLPADTLPKLDAAVSASHSYTAVYRNPDAVVYRFVPAPPPVHVRPPETSPHGGQ